MRHPFHRLAVKPQMHIFFGNHGTQFARFLLIGYALEAGFEAAAVAHQRQQAAVSPALVLAGFVIIDGTGFLQLGGFVEHLQRIAVVKRITQLQTHQAGEAGVDLCGGVEVVFGSRIIAPTQRRFGQQQIAGKLLFRGQGFDVFQITVAQGGVVHLVGRVRAQHQGQRAVVAGFFIGQHFGGFLLSLLKFAFKKRQTGIIQRRRCLPPLPRHAETLHAAGHMQNAGNQAHQQIKHNHQRQQAQDKGMQIDAQHGLFHHHIDIAVIQACTHGNGHGHGKQHDNPNQASHACSPFTAGAGAAGLAASGWLAASCASCAGAAGAAAGADAAAGWLAAALLAASGRACGMAVRTLS